MTSEESIDVSGRGRWRFRATRGGFLELLRSHAFKNPTPTLDALGPYWILGFARIKGGQVRYRTSSAELALTDQYGLFIGPWSIVQGVVDTPDQEIRCIISDEELPAAYREAAFKFRIRANEPMPQNVKELVERLARAEDVVSVQYNAAPSTLARRIKRLIDGTYAEPLALSALAARLRIDQSTVGRVFKKSFGLTPVLYRNHMRVAISSFKLLGGQMIADVFQDVGFADLSRYNKNFRAVTGTSPRKFQPKKAPKQSGRKTPRS